MGAVFECITSAGCLLRADDPAPATDDCLEVKESLCLTDDTLCRYSDGCTTCA